MNGTANSGLTVKPMYPNLVPFKRGKDWTGNRSGRPKVPPELLKALPDACSKLVAMMDHEDPAIALRAIERVIAWNIGQPGVADSGDPVDAEEAALELIKSALDRRGLVIGPKPLETRCEPTSSEPVP